MRLAERMACREFKLFTHTAIVMEFGHQDAHLDGGNIRTWTHQLREIERLDEITTADLFIVMFMP